jgi:hypothetical protein
MCAARREVVVHLQQGHRTVSRIVGDELETLNARMTKVAAPGQLVLESACFVWLMACTGVSLDRILACHDAVGA